jgi:hypothetical protein
MKDMSEFVSDQCLEVFAWNLSKRGFGDAKGIAM